MKKIILSVFIVTLSCFDLEAQRVEFKPTYGYQFGTKLNYGQTNYLKAIDSEIFGADIGFEVKKNYFIELSYLHHESELRIKDRVVSPREDFLSDLKLDWFLIGAVHYFETGSIVNPFIGGSMGVVLINPKNVNYDIAEYGMSSATRFTFGAKAGLAFMVNNNIGLFVQGNLLVPIEWGGFYFSGGTGGSGIGVDIGSTVLIPGVSGGLVFRSN